MATDNMDNLWRIQLFGTLKAQQGQYVIRKFRTQKAGLLLAYLAYYSHRSHSREELIEMLWPEIEPGTGRNRFKQALSSLRRQFEPGTADGLFCADRLHVSVYPYTITTDVAEFQKAVRESVQAATVADRKLLLCHAVDLYHGDLLSGFYEDWVLTERQRLCDAYQGALQQLVSLCREAGEWDQAVDYARRVLAMDPWQEEAHADLMRLYQAMGRPTEALRQYHELERILQEEMGIKPSASVRALAQQLHTDSNRVLRKRSSPSVVSPRSLCAKEKETSDRPQKLAGISPRLPVPLTRFFGREDELCLLQALLLPETKLTKQPASRLLTLTGPGGIGKTRLAVEAARRLAEKFPGGVWMVPLADMTDACLIPGAIVEALQLRRSPTLEPIEQVVAFFHQQESLETGEEHPALLVLDNFEHLVEEGAQTVVRLMEQLPSLFCLVTSRHSLNIEGEREVPLLPLPLPRVSDRPEILMEVPSVQLFVDRARARKVDFALSTRNAAAITALCHRLEGIPLALELAAGWARTLTSVQMLERLESGFDLLTSHRKDLHPRQLSLWATIEWSFRLLPPELQEFFVHLSVFRGGWTLEAAEAVCEEPQMLRYLDLLREYSLLLVEEHEGRMRYHMLETIRQYSEEKLLTSSKADTLFKRHRDFYLALVETRIYPEMGREHDNIRAAMEWCLAHTGDVEIGLRLIQGMSIIWSGRGFWEEGRRYIGHLLSRPPANLLPEQRALALYVEAYLTIRQGEFSACRTLCEEALAIWQEQDDKQNMALILSVLATVSEKEGDYEQASTLYQQCLTIYQEAQDCHLFVAGTLHNLACVAQAQGDFDAAWELQQKSLHIYRQSNWPGGIALCLGFLGDVARLQGDYSTSWQLLKESITLFRQLGETPRVAEMLVRQAAVAECQGERATAHKLLEESLPILREMGDRPHIVFALQIMAALAAADGQYLRAARLYGSAQSLRESMHMPLPQGEQLKNERDLAGLRQALGETQFLTHFQAGSRLPWTQAIQEALAER